VIVQSTHAWPLQRQVIAGTWYAINEEGIGFTRAGEMEIHADLRSLKRGLPPLCLDLPTWQKSYSSA
jgi:hypothetical protein